MVTKMYQVLPMFFVSLNFSTKPRGVDIIISPL